jgi:hypothetical protein
LYACTAVCCFTKSDNSRSPEETIFWEIVSFCLYRPASSFDARVMSFLPALNSAGPCQTIPFLRNSRTIPLTIASDHEGLCDLALTQGPRLVFSLWRYRQLTRRQTRLSRIECVRIT